MFDAGGNVEVNRLPREFLELPESDTDNIAGYLAISNPTKNLL